MSDKSGKECGCPECTAARESGKMNGSAAADLMAPLMERHHALSVEIIEALAKVNNHVTKEVGKDLAFVLLSPLMTFVETTLKPDAPANAKFDVFDLFVKQAVEACKHIDAQMNDDEIPEAVKAFADMLGIDLKNVTVLKI